jgi:hypothetical protein
VNDDLTQEQWLEREKALNLELLRLQRAMVTQGQRTMDEMFEFQCQLLSTRALMQRDPGTVPASAQPATGGRESTGASAP